MKFCYLNSITFRDLFKLYGNENVKNSNGEIGEFHKSIFSLSGLNENTLKKTLSYPLHQMNEQLLRIILLPLSSHEYLNYEFIDSFLKFCPLCLRNKYHSTLHQFSYIHNCPFHKIKLFTQCPKCNIKIPYDLIDGPMLNNYSCSCGFSFSPDNRTVKSSFSPHIIDTDVKKWITLIPSEISKIQKGQILDEYFLALDYEKVVFQYDIPFIFNSLDVKNNANYIGGNYVFLDHRLVRERANKYHFLKTKKQYQDFFEDIDEAYAYKQADKICNSIARYLRKTILKKHICCIKELTRYGNELEKEEYCPFAIAYVYWRFRLQGFKSYKDVDNWGTSPLFKENCREYGYPVYSYKFNEWLRKLQQENLVLPNSISNSRNTYLWVTNHLIVELIIAEFYRCIEYGLKWRDTKKKEYTINSIYSFKYMPMFLIHKEGNKYYCIKKEKTELRELYKLIKNTTCINSNKKTRRNRKKNRTKYVKSNPIIEALERRYKK